MCARVHPQKPEEGVWVSHAGIVGCWNCRLLCDIWCGCWEPNFRSFPRAANALNHWALSQPRPSPLFIIKRKTDTFYTFFVSFTENGTFLTNVDSVGHRYSSHDNGYVALKTEHRLCTPQNRPSTCNTSWHCITTRNEHLCSFPTRVL